MVWACRRLTIPLLLLLAGLPEARSWCWPWQTCDSPTPAPAPANSSNHSQATTTTKTTTTTTSSTVTTTSITATSTKTATVTTSTSTTTVYCFEDDVAWEPHMNVTSSAKVEDYWQCQRLCVTTHGCAHFSLFLKTMECYLEDVYAIKREQRPGFVSGPFMCMEKMGPKEVQQVLDDAKIPAASGCLQVGVVYEPSYSVQKVSELQVQGDDREQVIHTCQQKCHYDNKCAFYTVDFNLGICKLAPENAQPIGGFVGAVSGAPTCGHKEGGSHEYLPLNTGVPFKKKYGVRGSQAQHREAGLKVSPILAPLTGAAMLVAGVAFMTVAFMTCRRRRPSGIFGNRFGSRVTRRSYSGLQGIDAMLGEREEEGTSCVE